MLSLQLNHGSLQQGFKHHWRTQDCKVTHIFFADGLIPNVQKSQCFLASTDSATSQSILDLLGFSLGNLPTKVLGVPLISSKLSYQDCTPLLHKITHRVTSWTSCVLVYSSRLQLIQSVLFSMQSYWCSHFLLPKAIIRSIQSILCRFLWKGNSLAKYGAKVA